MIISIIFSCLDIVNLICCLHVGVVRSGETICFSIGDNSISQVTKCINCDAIHKPFIIWKGINSHWCVMITCCLSFWIKTWSVSCIYICIIFFNMVIYELCLIVNVALYTYKLFPPVLSSLGHGCVLVQEICPVLNSLSNGRGVQGKDKTGTNISVSVNVILMVL